MSIPLDHARHNKKACDKLNELQEFPDWTVTTAFYCAMHYVYAIVFPLTRNGKVYKTFEHYYSQECSSESKHKATHKLLFSGHFSIAEKYKNLMDAAFTSRYHDYEIHPAVVNKMRVNMNKIAEYCEEHCAKASAPSDPNEEIKQA